MFITVDVETYRRIDEVASPGGTSAKLAVAGKDTGVNNEDCDAGPSAGVIDIGRGILGPVGNAAKTICGASLSSQSRGVHVLVLLNVGNLKIVRWCIN